MPFDNPALEQIRNRVFALKPCGIDLIWCVLISKQAGSSTIMTLATILGYRTDDMIRMLKASGLVDSMGRTITAGNKWEILLNGSNSGDPDNEIKVEWRKIRTTNWLRLYFYDTSQCVNERSAPVGEAERRTILSEFFHCQNVCFLSSPQRLNSAVVKYLDQVDRNLRMDSNHVFQSSTYEDIVGCDESDEDSDEDSDEQPDESWGLPDYDSSLVMTTATSDVLANAQFDDPIVSVTGKGNNRIQHWIRWPSLVSKEDEGPTYWRKTARKTITNTFFVNFVNKVFGGVKIGISALLYLCRCADKKSLEESIKTITLGSVCPVVLPFRISPETASAMQGAGGMTNRAFERVVQILHQETGGNLLRIPSRASRKQVTPARVNPQVPGTFTYKA